MATDAIGMGLNLDIDCVVFTALDKHDGIGRRDAHLGRGRPDRGPRGPPRPGRPLRSHRRSWGRSTTDWYARSEGHRFPPLEIALLAGNRSWTSRPAPPSSRRLERRPPHRGCARMAEADDHRALKRAPRVAGESRRAPGDPRRWRLLWDVCQVPDFLGTRERSPHPAARRGLPAPLGPGAPAARVVGRRTACATWTAGRAARPPPRPPRRHPHLDLRVPPRGLARATPRTGRSGRARWRTASPTRSTSG